MQTNRRSDYNDGLIAGMVIEMSQDLTKIDRSIYSMADWFNEIGGFSQAISVFFFSLIPLLQFWTINEYLITKLYKSQP